MLSKRAVQKDSCIEPVWQYHRQMVACHYATSRILHHDLASYVTLTVASHAHKWLIGRHATCDLSNAKSGILFQMSCASAHKGACKCELHHPRVYLHRQHICPCHSGGRGVELQHSLNGLTTPRTRARASSQHFSRTCFTEASMVTWAENYVSFLIHAHLADS